MVVCYLCKEEFKDNSGGQLTNHLLDIHKISKSDYHVIAKLNGVEPKCACGYCDNRPSFYRNGFKKYASGHDNPKFKENQYIKKFGKPNCKTCGESVKFHRGDPNTYCEISCRPSNWNQEKVKNTVKEKYGVDNIMNVEEFRNRLSLSLKDTWVKNHDEIVNKIKSTTFERFGVEFAQQCESVKQKQRETIMKNHGVSHYSKTDKFRKDSSNRMMLNNPYNSVDIWKNNILKVYKSTDLKYQSSYEYDFLEFCEKNQVLHLIKKSPSFRYINRESYHFPDYLYNDCVVIEIKSKWILDIQGGDSTLREKITSVENGGVYRYLLLLDKDYLQFEELITK